LKKAAKLKVPQQMPDLEMKLLVMCMADRADDNGHFSASDETLMHELANEVNAIKARLKGDLFLRAGVDNNRVARVLRALMGEDEE